MSDSATVKLQAQHIAKTSQASIRLSENVEHFTRQFRLKLEETKEKLQRTNVDEDLEEAESRYFVDHY